MKFCVLSQKFRNLHIYGYWWYLNNPSIIDEITRMRIELLGSAFTALGLSNFRCFCINGSTVEPLFPKY